MMHIVFAGVVANLPTSFPPGDISCITIVFLPPLRNLTGIRGHIVLLVVDNEVIGGISGIICNDAEIFASIP